MLLPSSLIGYLKSFRTEAFELAVLPLMNRQESTYYSRNSCSCNQNHHITLTFCDNITLSIYKTYCTSYNRNLRTQHRFLPVLKMAVFDLTSSCVVSDLDGCFLVSLVCTSIILPSSSDSFRYLIKNVGHFYFVTYLLTVPRIFSFLLFI